MMPAQSIHDLSKRLSHELETIIGRPVADGDEKRPLHELGVDSLGLVELLVVIEKEFGLSLMEAGLSADHFRSLERLATAIHDRL